MKWRGSKRRREGEREEEGVGERVRIRDCRRSRVYKGVRERRRIALAGEREDKGLKD